MGVIGGDYQPEQALLVPDNQHLFLRVIPKSLTQEIGSSKRVLDVLKEGKIGPFKNKISAFSYGRNQHGAFAVEHEKGKVFGLTQLFRNRELWGIDADTIDKKSGSSWLKVEFGFFPCSSLEESFNQTLSTYLPFCRDLLKLTLPLKFIAGATKVKGYRMVAPQGMHFGRERFGGRVVEEHIIYEGNITDYDMASTVILRPFFEKIWEECGLSRPDREQL